ncbi:MAG: restriction endonuclease subunit S [Acidimicrobiaceae bacterium]|nr:restriction endonuclease subunit S [Acidimicrobiaceae bacterium]
MSTTEQTWGTFQLHDVCRPKQWKTIKKSEMTESGYPVYGANGVIGRYHSFNHVDPTILVGCRGSCGMVNVSEPNAWVTGNAMALDDLDTAVVDLGFLVHVLRADGLHAAITGTSQPQITQASLKRVWLPLPPMHEQRRIATMLDAAEALRAKRRQALAKLDDLTQALFLGMFADPSHHGSTVRAPIGSVAEVVTGNTPPRSDPANFGTHVEWLKTNNIRESGEIECASEFLSESGRAKGREAPTGASLVVCIAGSPRSIGRVGFLDRPAAFNQQINAVVPGPSLRAQFLFHQLRAAQRLIQRASTNSMKGMVSKSALAAVEILVPPLRDQDEFVEVVERISRVRELASRSLAATATLFASMQQRAFRGEL